MNQSRTSKQLPILISFFGIFSFFGILLFLYRSGNYLPTLLGAIFLLLLGAVNLILLIFHKDIPIKDVPPQAANEETSSKAPKAIWIERLHQLSRTLASFYNRSRRTICCALLLASLVGMVIWMSLRAFGERPSHTPTYWHLIVLVASFIVAIVLDKLCKHTEADGDFATALLKNFRAFFNLTKILTFLLSVSVALVLLNIYDVQVYLIYAIVILFYYVAAMILVSLAVHILRRELDVKPTVVILLPFFGADAKELSIISFLEENTGITLRSLWSIKYVRSILPAAVLGTIALLWFSTGIVYVESQQEAVVYRLGSMQEEVLEPGLHFTLPYPLDKTEICNTKTIHKITIGYKSVENVDNVWTKDHGDSEYKLLLGSGNELVSLNLRIEYRISDLKKYLQNATSPDRIVEAKAYELTTSRTMTTDLHTLLSVDREKFAADFREELAKSVVESDTGIEIVNVIMESIHPPVEVAQVYQDFIGVGIDAERILIEAKAQAAVRGFEAESQRLQILNSANSVYYDSVAAARAEVSEFMAAVEAYNGNPDTYTYYKYMQAIGSA
jgi:membrane protease subunit HflK